ncbi:MAG TPA: hypothetical protein VFA32_24860 [Dehalococcoidia bacterium]|nr:hypothetical protein [Dehalococcoidia bacterium]
MQQKHNSFTPSIPLPSTPRETPTLSITGLLDLLTALEDQLVACPGSIPVLSITLRDVLAEVVNDVS